MKDWIAKELWIHDGVLYHKKSLNNNVLIVEHQSYGEVVLIGKGIGFGKKPGDVIEEDNIEKCLY